MSKSKDKRIKKLGKKRIWLSVMGLVFILFLFFCAIMTVLATSTIDVIQRKLTYSRKQSEKIAQMCAEYEEASFGDIRGTLLTYVDLMPEIEAVSIMGAEGEQKWSSNGSYPDMNRAAELDFLTDMLQLPTRVIIEEDYSRMFEIEDGTIFFSNDILNKIDYQQLMDTENYFTTEESAPVIYFKVWFVMPAKSGNVMVLNQISLYASDLFMMLVSLAVCALLLCVFTLYYMISFISILVNMHRTSRIIYTDLVTGGDNWLHFVKKGTSLLKHNRSNRHRYAMIHLKMRKYRSFCTCFGVREGEELIEKFYRALKKQMRHREIIAHHENAEFGLLLAYTSKEQLVARIEELENILDGVLPSMKLYFGVGVYQIEPGERDVEQLYNNALIACDMLGEEAENKIAFFDVEMNKQKLWERRVEDDMDRALANKEFKVYLQPKISTSEEKLAGAEALVRWIHPTEGFIPPNKFIPIFEQNGFILKLDDYMLEEIAAQQARWIAQGRKIVPISVNVSRAHFTREDLAEHIAAIVDKYNVPHDVIELELTESAFFDDKKVLLSTVKKLHEAGFIVSMDDFGAGYSSLNSLKELHIDVLKIDGDFFRGADVEERGMLIVAEVIDLAKKLNMKIVAEGIENREQVDFLAAQECDLIQGYFFAKPMPIDEFVEKYKEQ
ncbi:MAG: GGDEF domain-containing protein [Lachnospiraceae bacterium]|nr:GGDEF domain-containing protein [Lachnospiraceae bacterium]